MNALSTVIELSREPQDEQAYDAWIRQEEVVPFLDKDGADEDMIIYAGLPHVFIHAILIPRFDVTSEAVASLLNWNFNASSGWNVVGSGQRISIEAPLAWENISLIQSGEQIVFFRCFEGVRHKSSYFELSQKIAHVLGLHCLEDRDAWCKLNRQGDIDEIVKCHRVGDCGANEGTVITMRTSELAEFASAGGYVVLRMFDFTRFRPRCYSGWGEERVSQPLPTTERIFGHLTMCGATGSFSRGVQILDLEVRKSDAIAGDEEHAKRYATFIALDWRHDKIGEFSCDPAKLANYFVSSPHPFETSPAFFRPEVLNKYKSDSEKYTIEHRSISCRGAWYLRAIGFNDAGQVHAYLGYLGDLPYEEQLHWKQFNEPPKARLSRSVIMTDFEGQFSDEYDPLVALKQELRAVNERRVGWWTMRDDTLPNRVHYPLTDARDDWASELMNLDQLLVEGLVEKWLRKRAVELGRNPDDRLRPLKLLEECLCGVGFEESHSRQIMSPWHKVHNLRSELKGHASSPEGRRHEAQARKEHGSLLGHFRQLCEDCDESLRIIVSAIETGH